MTDCTFNRDDMGATAHHRDAVRNVDIAKNTSTSVDIETALIQAMKSAQTATINVERNDTSPNGSADLQLYLLFETENATILHTLNKEQRNTVVRNNPAVAAACNVFGSEYFLSDISRLIPCLEMEVLMGRTSSVSSAYRQLADQNGTYSGTDCVVMWKSSFIPFHLEYTIAHSNGHCQHLASIKNGRAKDPVQYAKNVIPLAKAFLSKPYGSRQPHLPFIWPPSENRSPESLDPGESKARMTIEHGRLIELRFKPLEEMDITMAETTAKLINANKIIPGLLEMIFKSGSKSIRPNPDSTEVGENSIEPTSSETTSSGETSSEKTKPKERIQSKTISKQPKSIGIMGKEAIKKSNSQGFVEPAYATMHKSDNPKPPEIMPEFIREQEHDETEADAGNNAAHTPTARKRKTRAQRATLAKEKSFPDGPDDVRPKVRSQQSESDPGNDAAIGPYQVETTSTEPAGAGEPTSKQEIVPEAPNGGEEITIVDATSEEEHPSTEMTVGTRNLVYETVLEPFQSVQDFAVNKVAIDRESQQMEQETTNPELSSPKAPVIENSALPPENALRRFVLESPTPSKEASNESVDFPPEVIPELSLPPPISVFENITTIGHHIIEETFDCVSDNIIEEEILVHYCPPENDLVTEDELPLDIEIDNSGDCDDSVCPALILQPSLITGGRLRVPAWTYVTHTELDIAFLDAGIWLWEKPTTYLNPRMAFITVESGFTIQAPVIVSHESTGDSCPLIEFDGEKVHIVPHIAPWQDLRSCMNHPDFLPFSKLVEYQACEAAGYKVWRHDRELLPCRKPDCNAQMLDGAPSTVFCLGCGPKTLIRYCSLQHQVDDLDEHWQECGSPNLVMKCVIDDDTAPQHFFDKPPRIIDRNGIYGIRSPRLYRQQLHSMNNNGYYTLFSPISQHTRTLSWPNSYPNWQELDERIERLLNIAYFDTRKHQLIKYLYRLLRELLYSSGDWNAETKELLDRQINEEFNPTNDKIWDPTSVKNNPPCDCEWSGRKFLPHGQLSTCACRPESNGIGPQSPTAGAIRIQVERLENRYWILRAWRQQHPMEKDWRVRANGYGMIPLAKGEELYELGSGWTGWGGGIDNMHGSNWEVMDREMRKRFFAS